VGTYFLWLLALELVLDLAVEELLELDDDEETFLFCFSFLSAS
jgi:hypothetical protein